jgi:ABC-type phosphate/phosphonate transport system substrate-binding protein
VADPVAAPLFSNARMYAVTPAVEAAWTELLRRVVDDAGTGPLDYLPYPAPQPLEALWRRPDLGCALMCGYPIALGLAAVTPIAAPVPSAAWAAGRPVYRSDLVVAAESRFGTLVDTFGGTAGWTVAHSHSGFNAFRYHLLRYRTADRPTLYGRVVGDLVTARAILDRVADGTLDVGPLDAYWHMLIARADPALAARVRTVESTDTAPMPAFVAGPAVPSEAIAALRAAFAAAASRPWFPPLAETLMVTGFAPVDHASFAVTRARDGEAVAAGYPLPA